MAVRYYVYIGFFLVFLAFDMSQLRIIYPAKSGERRLGAASPITSLSCPWEELFSTLESLMKISSGWWWGTEWINCTARNISSRKYGAVTPITIASGWHSLSQLIGKFCSFSFLWEVLPFTNKFEMTVESNTYISPMGSHASASWVNRLCFSHKVRVRLLVATLVDKSVYFHLQFGTQCSCVPIHSNGRYLHRSAKFFLRLHLCCRKVGAAQKSVPFRTMQCDANLELRLDMGVLWCWTQNALISISAKNRDCVYETATLCKVIFQSDWEWWAFNIICER